MPTLGERALIEAKADLGVREDPPGSNTGTRVREMQANTWLEGTKWPWCAAAVCTWYKEAGYALPDPSAGAWDLTERAVKNGWGRNVPIAAAGLGTIVSFKTGAGHVAVLERFDATTMMVHTIDGNVDDMVKRCIRPVAEIYMAVTVPGTDPTPPTPSKPPVYQLVTSQFGTEVVVFSSRNLDKVLGKAATLIRRGFQALVRQKPVT